MIRSTTLRYEVPRRQFLHGVLGAAAAGMLAGPLAAGGARAAESSSDGGANDPIDIGSRRELFVEDTLIDQLEGEASLRLHHPTPQEIVLVHDEPWEGTGSGYHSVFQDGDLYRMYYKAWHLDVQQGKVNTQRHPLYCCYAESDDGIAWRKPKLGLHEFEGSKENNITMASGRRGGLNIDAGHPAVFKDENPAAAADARYKAIVRSAGPNGLIPMKSPDGIHWTPMSDKPILSGLGAFDSQNLAFWDPLLGKYRGYWRIFSNGVRAIRTATSEDLLQWSDPIDVTYDDSPAEHLYTNQVKPYYRAPHLLVGFPTRYMDRGWSPSMKALPELEHREMRASAVQRYGTVITEALLMASRDGRQFKRWNSAFLRPGIERPGTWNYGHQYIGWHVVETTSSLPGAPPELSLYASESYWTGQGSALRRYTLRLDGFVSAAAPMKGGTLVTKPFRFSGKQLALNFSTSAAGGLRVEIQHPDGKPVEGFALEDCHELFGDTIERPVGWKQGGDVGRLSGRPVRLRFELRDADLYAFRFTDA